MEEPTITKLIQSGEFEIHLTEVLRSRVQQLLAQAIEVQVESILTPKPGKYAEFAIW